MLHEMMPQLPKTAIIPRAYMAPLEETGMAWRLCVLRTEALFSDSTIQPPLKSVV